MTVLRWAVSSLLGFFGGWAIIGNWVGVAQASLTRPKGHYSLVPLIGGVVTAIALGVAPSDPLNRLWWVPLIADLGCLPLLLMTGIFFARQWLRRG